jgi:cysteine synthase
MNIGEPAITDYSELLGIKNGKVYGIELRLMGPAGSHKDLMIASLLTTRLMTQGVPWEGMDTIVDAGFFNSAWATKYYANLFGLKGAYFIQETTPKHLLEKLEGPNFEVNRVAVPDSSTGIDKKNATYRALLRRFHYDSEFNERVLHLGHAEIGFFSTYCYGRMFAKLMKGMDIIPDLFLTGVGAGTTLIGIGEPLQDAFGTEIDILEWEEKGPVKSTIPDKYYGVIDPSVRTIPDTIRSNTEAVDEQLLLHLRNVGYDVGITSTAALAVGSQLAEENGINVVVPIFEYFRDYSKNVRNVISRELQLNPFIPEDFWQRVSNVYHLIRKPN